MLTDADVESMTDLARAVRRHVVRMSGQGGCFIGASLSCADLLVYLYSRWLAVSPDRIDDPLRDVLLLSKGHDVPALYGTLAELGYLDPRRLSTHLSTDDDIYWHPNTNIPGVEFHSGSLGHLPAVGVGVALSRMLDGIPARTVVLMGDGELNEGSVWEAALVAGGLGVTGLTFVVDRNRHQANMPTEKLLPLEPLAEKFAAFGWDVLSADGHDFRALDSVFESIGPHARTVVVAETVRGKGIRSLEEQPERWFAQLGASEVDRALHELESGVDAAIGGPALVVR